MKKRQWLKKKKILGALMVGQLLEIISSQSMGSNDDYSECTLCRGYMLNAHLIFPRRARARHYLRYGVPPP